MDKLHVGYEGNGKFLPMNELAGLGEMKNNK